MINLHDPIGYQKELYHQQRRRLEKSFDDGESLSTDDQRSVDEQAKRHPSSRLELASDRAEQRRHLDLETLGAELHSERLIFISLYQTLPECRGFAAQLSHTLSATVGQRPLAVALDNYGAEFQPQFDQLHEVALSIQAQKTAADENHHTPPEADLFFENELHNEAAQKHSIEILQALERFDAITQTRQRLGSRFWLSMQPLFQLAALGKIKLLAADVSDESLTSRVQLTDRDHLTATVVDRWLQENQHGLCIVLAGEARIYRGELYETLQKHNPALILQANEEVYWRLAGEALESQEPNSNTVAKSFSLPAICHWHDRLYSATHLPPLVKLDSYATWLHQQETWPGWPLERALKKTVQMIREGFKLYRESGAGFWSEPILYCCADLNLLRRLKQRSSADDLSDDERSFLLHSIEHGESCYLPGAHLIYLHTLDVAHFGEEVGHALRLHYAQDGERVINSTPRQRCYSIAANEAAGYLASKFIAPARQSDGDGQRELDRLLQLSPTEIEQAYDDQQAYELAHRAGYALGQELYQQLESGAVEVGQVRALFVEPLSSESKARELVQNMLRLSRQVLGRERSLKQRLTQVAAVYLLLFAVAIAWGESRQLFLFPDDLLSTLGNHLVYACGAAAAVIGISWMASKISGTLRSLTDIFAQLLGPLTTSEAFLVAAFSSIAEEFFFRGVLQAEVGYIPASLAFGLVHYVPDRRFYPWTVMAILVGFLFGWIYMVTENLLVPVLAHFLVNFVNIVLIRRQSSAAATSVP